MQERWGQARHAGLVCKELQGVCMGQAVWGTEPRSCPGLQQLLPRRLLSHCQAAVFSPDLIFYYTSRKGLQGHLREPWRSHRLAQGLFWRWRSPRSTEAVLGWLCPCDSKAVFVSPVRTSSDWWIPSDCNAMPVNMH